MRSYAALCGAVVALLFLGAQGKQLDVTFTQPGARYILRSPGYPDNAPAFSNVIWKLTAPVGQKVVLTCPDVRLLRRVGCSEGSLTVWNGATQYNMCNVVSNFERESRKNLMYVQFRSGFLGVGKLRCRARAVERSLLDDLDVELDSREHGKGVGSKTTTCPCGWTNKRRIVGGKETQVHEYPSVVSIITLPERQRFCGGSIITPVHVLTAAHCTHGVDRKLGVVIGEHDFSTKHETNATRTIRVREVIEHKDYVHKDMTNDIALLVLERRITFNQHVGPICLPSHKYDLLHKHIKVLGWGLTADGGTFSDVLKKVSLEVIPLTNCSAKYKNFIDLENPSQFCTHGNKKDTCQGDSGGPMMYHDPDISRYVQVALVSYGKECASDIPAVNTDVFFFTNWIEEQVNKYKPSVHTCVKIE